MSLIIIFIISLVIKNVRELEVSPKTFVCGKKIIISKQTKLCYVILLIDKHVEGEA